MKPRRARFGYPDMNPATLLFLTQELRRARTKHPKRDKNQELIRFYIDQLDCELEAYAFGPGNAQRVFTTGLQIAVMAIRLVEEGIAGNPYRGNAPSIGGPLGEYNPEQDYTEAAHPSDKTTDEMEQLTKRIFRK